MFTIGIILGSTRPHRVGDQIAQWVLEVAGRRDDAHFELVDLRDHPLPFLESGPLEVSPTASPDPEVRRWAERVASFDGFVLVTPEYNASISSVLKNAMDTVYTEWNNKAVGFVSYGVTGGARAVQQLQAVCGSLQMADVIPQVLLSTRTDFENHAVLQVDEAHAGALTRTLDQIIAWSGALAPLRTPVHTNVA